MLVVRVFGGFVCFVVVVFGWLFCLPCFFLAVWFFRLCVFFLVGVFVPVSCVGSLACGFSRPVRFRSSFPLSGCLGSVWLLR